MHLPKTRSPLDYTAIANRQRAGELPPWGNAETLERIPLEVLVEILDNADEDSVFVGVQCGDGVVLLYELAWLRARLERLCP